MSGRAPVSAVIIGMNCAHLLEPCLQSLRFCDEILLVDSGSTDHSVQVAERHGARVLHQDWLGFGPQKQFAVAAARHDWVLCVDSDERVTQELAGAITAALAAPAAGAYRFARTNRFMGRYLRHGEGYPDWSLRLFDRRQARWSDDAVHEKVLYPGEPATLPGDLLHDTEDTLESYIAKQNRYTTLAARQAVAAGKRAGALRLVASPLLRFVKFYFVRRGFLDGLPGLVHISIGCFNSFLKYAKIQAFRRESAPRDGS
ncbi:MAG: glycosyltransferase family 2 protein [Rhodocyclaceae bacterium]|nr:glycosyltransferase family 2 protein [Rhodocyclaceae bacterium]MBX3669146.1 glycosyltransferase family 2 protein [Rhodocyclaceae bacterium]